MSFDQVYWLGGITCSGKSTTAICIADRLGLELYSTDASFDLHLLRVRQDLHPTMYEFVVDARGGIAWVRAQDIATQVGIWRRFYGERFTLIVEDLEDLVALGQAVLVEGVELFPDYVLRYSA